MSTLRRLSRFVGLAQALDSSQPEPMMEETGEQAYTELLRQLSSPVGIQSGDLAELF